MKKNIYFSLFFICLKINLLQAQSFSIPSATYSTTEPSTESLINVPVPITNASNNTLDIIVEKTVNNLAPHHSSLFCFGISCYDTSINATGIISFAGHTTETLAADLNTNYTPGQSCVTYRIKDSNNPTDFAEVQICYNISATGINTINNSSSVSLPSPNPADRFTALTYSLNGNVSNYTISVFNILGNKVQENKLSTKSGALILPTSELTSGVYFYSLTEGTKVLSTNKLVVSHKN